MAERTRLGVIFGGRSVEHEVSVVSAIEVMKAADGDRFDVIPFGVTREGRWLTPDETQQQLAGDVKPYERRIEGDVGALSERPEVIAALGAIDVALPLIHGVNGEDGTLQGMLEMLALPYAGCGVAASAIGMDKGLQKELFQRHGIDVAPYLVVKQHEWTREERGITAGIEQALSYPVFVKPANGGSSVGVSVARSREDLGEAMAAAFGIGAKVLVEEAVRGREVECGVLGNEDPQPSPVGEVVPAGEFYDYSAKYLDDSARLIAPADLPEETVETVQDAAVAAFEAIDGAGFARVDFFVSRDGDVVLNEINTIPGFTPISMFPRLWALAGVSYRELISRLVDLALARFGRKEAQRAR